MNHLIDMMRYWDWNYANLLGYIVTLGAVTMALLQLINDLTPIRAICHTYLLRQWIGERVNLYKKQSGSRPVSADDALAQLIAHATGGHWRALLGLPPPQLVAQINAAAQGALENPEANYSLIAVLSQPAETQIPLVLQRGQVAARVPSHIEDLSVLLEAPSPPSPPVAEGDQTDAGKAAKDYEDNMKRYVEARTRVVHRIQRNLDGMQITLGNTSALVTQLLAILISVLICYIITVNTRSDPERTYFATVLLLGISAGYIAPLLGDLVMGLRRWGRAS
jgi:hypothetical protein